VVKVIGLVNWLFTVGPKLMPRALTRRVAGLFLRPSPTKRLPAAPNG
jgi:hypothetical protein